MTLFRVGGNLRPPAPRCAPHGAETDTRIERCAALLHRAELLEDRDAIMDTLRIPRNCAPTREFIDQRLSVQQK
jgi:hypothetical protein